LVVLISAFFLILASCQSKLTENLITVTAKNVTAPEVHVAFVGDVILHERLRKREEKTREGFQLIWSDLQSQLESNDVTYANLEGPVAPTVGGVTGYPMFNFPEEIIPALKNSGFDVVSTGNNHALDRSSKGIEKTIENLKKYDLKFTGTRALDTDPWYALTEVKSLNAGENKKYIAWLACTEMANGNADHKKQVLYCYKAQDEIKKLVTQLSQDYLAVIVTPHWGTEDTFQIADNRRLWAQQMIEAGAVAIVGSHPHVIQTIETYKDAVIAYSLGNFVSNQSKLKNKLSMIFQLQLKLDGGKLKYAGWKTIPLWMSRVIQKDGTAKYRLIETDFTKIPPEAKKIWDENIKVPATLRP
jgi:poly-gamma-glutamate capsule biosynthesis protein CapA/YwtB (metallophosphatase superfamily)